MIKSKSKSKGRIYKIVFCNNTKSLDNKTTVTSSMSLTYLLWVALKLRPTRQRHENRLYIAYISYKGMCTYRGTCTCQNRPQITCAYTLA